MGTGSVDDHDDEFVRMSRTRLGQKLAHPFSVHFPADHPIQLTFQRTDCAVDVGEFALVAVVRQRAFRGWCPAASNPNHASEASFVLKH